MKYLVQEFVAGKWFNTRSFDNEADAVDWSKRYRKSRIVDLADKVKADKENNLK